MTGTASFSLITLAKYSNMPTVTATTKTNAMPSISSSSETISTPSVTVPPSNNNPYILRTSGPLGLVFIAMGCVLGAILLSFAAFHLYKSLTSSRIAKRTLDDEKLAYQRYSGLFGGNVAPLGTTYFNNNTEYQGSVAKLPLLNASRGAVGGSQAGDDSTIFNYEGNHATSHQDLTQMFVSPTKEVMTHNKVRSQHANGSITNVSSLYGPSSTNMSNPSPATNRHSQLIPNLYIDEEINNSDYSIAQMGVQARQPKEDGTMPREGIKTLPSMYLEDLIEK